MSGRNQGVHAARAVLGFLKGSEMKYVWRYQHKGGLEDLRKATFYLARLISEVSV